MDKSRLANKEPEVRLLLACPRSGSALLARIFGESEDCAVTSQVLSTNIRGTREIFRPDDAALKGPRYHDVLADATNSGIQFLISKEELGIDDDGLYGGACPTPAAYALTRPVFLVRDPIWVFDSWKHLGWTDAQRMIDCYTSMFQMLDQAPPDAISCLIYEKLIQDPRTELKRLCERWGIPSEPPFIFSTVRERTLYGEGKSSSVLTAAADVPAHGFLSNAEKDNLEEHTGRLYLRCWRDEVMNLRAILAQKTWIGFDLDDTLHEFRRASSAATKKVMAKISQQYGVAMSDLMKQYSKILQVKTANAFSDGKTSFDYREERFSALLEHFSLSHDAQFMAGLLKSYEGSLAASLELKFGALGLLPTIKSMGKKIIVITEGPQDAQERTVAALTDILTFSPRRTTFA